MNQPTLLADLLVIKTATTKPTKRGKAQQSEADEQARSQAFLDTWRLWHLKQSLRGETLETVIAMWHEVNGAN